MQKWNENVKIVVYYNNSITLQVCYQSFQPDDDHLGLKHIAEISIVKLC